MRLLDLEERKAICLEIMKKIHDICIKNNITYYLAYGSLLGAIRHQGFIPWDDDLDIWIPINQFDHFLEVMKRESYDILFYKYNNGWNYHFIKVSDKRTAMKEWGKEYYEKRGIAVDVFPLIEYVNESWLKRVSSLQGILCQYRDDTKHYSGRICKLISLCVPERIIYTQFIKQLHRTGEEKLCNLFSPYDIKKDSYMKAWFEDRTIVPFEDASFYIPNGYHNILCHLYGDYMKPPEMKNTMHTVDAYMI